MQAGIAILMGNASEEVNNFSKEVIGHHQDNAVIKYLESNWELNPNIK
jgi:hydroxymethylpyrimidine pyrophosphatase-like HAD family hydrolase